jgi:hypothetical protein
MAARAREDLDSFADRAAYGAREAGEPRGGAGEAWQVRGFYWLLAAASGTVNLAHEIKLSARVLSDTASKLYSVARFRVSPKL